MSCAVRERCRAFFVIVARFNQPPHGFDFYTLRVCSAPREHRQALGCLHGGGRINFVMCDGSVRSISSSIDVNRVLPAMATIAGGEIADTN